MSATELELTRLTALHTRHLRRLIGAANTPQIAPGATKALMLTALQAAEIELLTTFAHITSDERDTRPVCGVWTLHDLIGHLADWDRYFYNWLTELSGEESLDLFWDDDGDAFNRQHWEARRGEPWAKTWDDFRTLRNTFVEKLDHVPDNIFLQPPPSLSRPFPTIYHCAWSALEHYLDHAAGVRRSLALPFPDALLSFHGPYTD